MSHDHSSCCTIQHITSIQDATTMKYLSALVTHMQKPWSCRVLVYSAQLIPYLGKNKQYKMRTFPKYHILWWKSQPFSLSHENHSKKSTVTYTPTKIVVLTYTPVNRKTWWGIYQVTSIVFERKYKLLYQSFPSYECQMALIDFTLSNARQFYSSMGNPLGWKGLIPHSTTWWWQCWGGWWWSQLVGEVVVD